MTNDYYFGYYFFAPSGRFEPCGMFTISHILSVILFSAAIVFVYLRLSRSFDNIRKQKYIRIIAYILTVTEVIKISHSFIYGEIHLDAWFPLSFCGLFIFAAWMAGFGKKHFKRAGELYISYAAPVAGVAFMIFPTTSLMSFPIWHYFSLYSLFYHSVMILYGLLFLSKEPRISMKNYKYYAMFVIIFALIAISINTYFSSNLMNLREPYNIPIQFLQDMYDAVPVSYTLITLLGYMIIPFIIELLRFKTKFVE